MRIITSATYHHLQQRAETANKVPGLETELENTTDKLTTYTRQHEDDTARIQALEKELEAATRQADTEIRKLRQQLSDTERAVNLLVQAVTTSSSDDAQREAARVIVENADRFYLHPEQLQAAEALLPRIYVLLSFGRLQSVHRSRDAAKAASCNEDISWDQSPRRVTSETELAGMFQAVMDLPVNGPWTKRNAIVLVLNANGIPVGAYGDTGPQHLADGHTLKAYALQEPVVATA